MNVVKRALNLLVLITFLLDALTSRTLHTRIVALIQAGDVKPTPEEELSRYPAKTGDVGALTPDDFASVPLMVIK